MATLVTESIRFDVTFRTGGFDFLLEGVETNELLATN